MGNWILILSLVISFSQRAANEGSLFLSAYESATQIKEIAHSDAASASVLFENTTANGFQLLQFGPNPLSVSSRTLTIVFQVFTQHPMKFWIIDTRGTFLAKGHWIFPIAGRYRVEIPVSFMAAGQYYLIIDAIGRPQTYPLTVLR